MAIFRKECRVLTDDGTVFLNLGDTYAERKYVREAAPLLAEANDQTFSVKRKDLIGIPWRTALALQQEGWYLRSEIIWHKPNAMPAGSLDDRPTPAHEHIFLLTKNDECFYNADAVREPVTSTGGACFGKQRHATGCTGAQSRKLDSPAWRNHPLGKNKRSVWTIPTRSFHGAHFAIFPAQLVEPCILAGSRKGDTVLDPFGGRGTTGVVAEALGRNAVLIELSPVYVEMQKHRETIEAILRERTSGKKYREDC